MGLFYTSSCEVYGDPDVFPTPESYEGRVDPLQPRSCYEEGKRFGETLCKAYPFLCHGKHVGIPLFSGGSLKVAGIMGESSDSGRSLWLVRVLRGCTYWTLSVV